LLSYFLDFLVKPLTRNFLVKRFPRNISLEKKVSRNQGKKSLTRKFLVKVRRFIALTRKLLVNSLTRNFLVKLA
jgi:hypothetical protein